jgi:hypothetical protein
MQHVRILVTRVVSDEFPAWVEFTLSGASGETWHFTDKLPVVSDLDSCPELPFESKIACDILRAIVQPDGSEVVEIDTAPWGIETATGESRFLVTKALLLDPPYAA